MPMWAIDNRTPYAAGHNWGRDKDGVHEWVVAVRATFDIRRNGALALAAEQPPPVLAPEYTGEDGASSLRYDTDLGPLKPTTDVVLNGSAYAPHARPATEFPVSVRVGPVQKALKVVGHRTWKAGVFGDALTPPEPVTKVPVVYERAYGGYDQADPDPRKRRLEPRNPVGCGLVVKAGLPFPNFEYPSGRVEKTGPAGFGAIAGFWSPRRELHGTFDEAWQKSRFPLLPADWDPKCTQCAPADQRAPALLRGGEEVELENLTPAGRLRFELPKITLGFRTRLDGRLVDHEGQLSTVILEPDVPRVILVWQSVLKVRTNGDYLEETIVREKPRHESLADG
jgi:hypothetical protein